MVFTHVEGSFDGTCAAAFVHTELIAGCMKRGAADIISAMPLHVAALLSLQVEAPAVHAMTATATRRRNIIGSTPAKQRRKVGWPTDCPGFWYGTYPYCKLSCGYSSYPLNFGPYTYTTDTCTLPVLCSAPSGKLSASRNSYCSYHQWTLRYPVQTDITFSRGRRPTAALAIGPHPGRRPLRRSRSRTRLRDSPSSRTRCPRQKSGRCAAT